MCSEELEETGLIVHELHELLEFQEKRKRHGRGNERFLNPGDSVRLSEQFVEFV
jgi:hypothetical protein